MEELRKDAAQMTGWQRHRFFVLIAGVIIISGVLVSISMSLYYITGASQVDVSVPGLTSVQKQATLETGNANDSFPSTGKLDVAAFDAFSKSYNNHLKFVSTGDNFNPAAMSTDNLQVFATQSPTQTLSAQ